MLIVSGDGVVFMMIAQELRAAIGEAAETTVAIEASATSPLAVLRQRLRKGGWVRGLDQFAFKVFDLLVLRRTEERRARERLESSAPADRIPPLNSASGLDFLRSGGFDVVACIATSIIGRAALAIPKQGFINIHPGVMPRYRGTGNLWAVCAQDWDHVGFTVHWMTERIDAGRIIARGPVAPVPESLWALHVAALRAGVAALAQAVRSGSLLDAEVDASGEASAYQGWYGFADYFRFVRSQRRHRRGI